MLQIGDNIVVKDPDKTIDGEMQSQETVTLLKALNYIGVITRIEENLYFVGFVHDTLGWITQVYKENEIEKVD